MPRGKPVESFKSARALCSSEREAPRGKPVASEKFEVTVDLSSNAYSVKSLSLDPREPAANPSPRENELVFSTSRPLFRLVRSPK